MKKKRSNKRIITNMNSVNVYYDNRTIKRIVQASVRHSARIYGLANAIQKRLRLPVIHFRHGVPLQLLKRERKTRKNERNGKRGKRRRFAEESLYQFDYSIDLFFIDYVKINYWLRLRSK